MVSSSIIAKLWFDVGIKRYTTTGSYETNKLTLWFDVGIKRYTTVDGLLQVLQGCGLM